MPTGKLLYPRCTWTGRLTMSISDLRTMSHLQEDPVALHVNDSGRLERETQPLLNNTPKFTTRSRSNVIILRRVRLLMLVCGFMRQVPQ